MSTLTLRAIYSISGTRYHTFVIVSNVCNDMCDMGGGGGGGGGVQLQEYSDLRGSVCLKGNTAKNSRKC